MVALAFGSDLKTNTEASMSRGLTRASSPCTRYTVGLHDHSTECLAEQELQPLAEVVIGEVSTVEADAHESMRKGPCRHLPFIKSRVVIGDCCVQFEIFRAGRHAISEH